MQISLFESHIWGEGWYEPVIAYTGNKYRLLDEIMPLLFQHKYKLLVDVFAGSGCVSMNSKNKNVWMNDIRTSRLLNEWCFNKNLIEEMHLKLAKVIKEIGTDDFKSVWTEIKRQYNNTKDCVLLTILVRFSFNSDFRENKKGLCVSSLGKPSFSDGFIEKTRKYQERMNTKENIKITSMDFAKLLDEIMLTKKPDEVIIYLDPPYILTNASYNNIWNETHENLLFEKIEELHLQGYKFIISNLVEGKNKVHQQLYDFVEKYNLNKKFPVRVYDAWKAKKEYELVDKEILAWNF